ncbi:MAG: recombination mediator RecR [Candidatus Staskawiczbacteria bacterium]|jgi:recombination protein RecR
MFSETIQKLIDQFSRFPTVGPRTASRFVFYLIKLPKERVEELVLSIQALKEKIRYCSFCFNPFETNKESDLCDICENRNRDRNLLCVVEKEVDLITIEKTKRYKGLYFILGGTVSTLRKADVEKLKINELIERIKSPQKFGIATFKELIIATNPTPEGKATAILIERTIKENLKTGLPKITHLGLGLPIGAELEYADDETLQSAFEGRK